MRVYEGDDAHLITCASRQQRCLCFPAFARPVQNSTQEQYRIAASDDRSMLRDCAVRRLLLKFPVLSLLCATPLTPLRCVPLDRGRRQRCGRYVADSGPRKFEDL